MSEQAPTKELALREALKELTDLYSHIWDRVDGAFVLMPASIPRFEKAHAKAVRVLKQSSSQPPGAGG